jgi:hypothetical protein
MSISRTAESTDHPEHTGRPSAKAPGAFVAEEAWLTVAPVRTGDAGRRVFDDGRHLNLGQLKGNQGSQNYRVPENADLGQYRSVTIWCDRFNVSFGAATLAVEGKS